VTIPLTSTTALGLAVRVWHLSNAGTGYNNPSFNTLQVVLGYHWLIRQHGRRQLSHASANATTKL
jgi:hypothetical protein